MPEAQQQIVDLLESEERIWSTGEIKDRTEKSYAAVGNLLKRLQEIGYIESPSRGQWCLKTHFTISHTPRDREIVKSPQGIVINPDDTGSTVTTEGENN